MYTMKLVEYDIGKYDFFLPSNMTNDTTIEHDCQPHGVVTVFYLVLLPPCHLLFAGMFRF